MTKAFIVAALILVFLSGGAINLYHAVRYRTPPITTLRETPANSLPTFVTLRDITFDVDHLLKLKFGREVLFAPVRAKGAAPASEYPIVVQMDAADLIAAAGSKSPEALGHFAALAARTEVTGRVSSVDSRTLDSIRQAVPLVPKHVVVIGEGATPGMIQGIVMLVIGLGLAAITLAGGFKKVDGARPPAPAKV